MIFWYDIDSLQAFGNVNFQFKQNTLETDSMIYVSTDGFRGYSFEAYNESKFYNNNYSIIADDIIYNDYTQKMNLIGESIVDSKEQGVSGTNINLVFKDSLIQNIMVQSNGYIFNNHQAISSNLNYQLFKDEMRGNKIDVSFNNKN